MKHKGLTARGDSALHEGMLLTLKETDLLHSTWAASHLMPALGERTASMKATTQHEHYNTLHMNIGQSGFVSEEEQLTGGRAVTSDLSALSCDTVACAPSVIRPSANVMSDRQAETEVWQLAEPSGNTPQQCQHPLKHQHQQHQTSTTAVLAFGAALSRGEYTHLNAALKAAASAPSMEAKQLRAPGENGHIEKVTLFTTLITLTIVAATITAISL
ncbi:hypothetical protein Q8A67_019054 [Cirrhinus molitorella]|uniref:Uncharacterized protein n=1 Tax=Cirrhinus molitorella TaxID=172907 RepID=A0AA88TPC5_9TELE|nr:hypothetical protein Q8A67_019054 [Cirrhinus molitorella]